MRRDGVSVLRGWPHIAVIELDDGHKESDLVISREEIRRINGDIN